MKPALNLQAELGRLDGLTLFELRHEWRRLYRMAPPMRLSRDLTVRGIAYRLQERAHGGLSRSMLSQLAQSAAPLDNARRSDISNSAAFVIPKPGTRLIREWRGVTHTVLVRADGYEWQGERHRSLSVIARAITGAHWSGPRFFGLCSAKKRKSASDGSEPTAAHAGAKVDADERD